MLKVLKFAKDRWYVILAIIMLLFVQVYCELTLPDYTSDIVDVGIQSKGVKYPIPEKMSSDTYENLQLFMSDDEILLVEKYYSKKEDIFESELDKLSEEELTELESAMLIPEMMTFLLTSDSEEAKKMQSGLFDSLGMNKEQMGSVSVIDFLKSMPQIKRNAIREMLENQMSDYPEYMLEASGVSFVQAEYEKLDFDMNEYQMNYLKIMAVKMLLIAIIALAVSIIVGYLSSKLAAFTAKELRQRIFSKVMSFSNAEMNSFSTSSLITRCTVPTAFILGPTLQAIPTICSTPSLPRLCPLGSNPTSILRQN